MKSKLPFFALVFVGLAACGPNDTAAPEHGGDGVGVAERELIAPFLYYPLGAFNGGVTCDFDCYTNHRGLDFAASYVPVYAAHEGTVSVRAFDSGGCGYFLYITHPTNGLSTKYCHFDSISIPNGAHVTRGTLLGISGATGRVTGPHVHFVVCRGGDCGISFGTAIDPGCPPGAGGACNDIPTDGNLWVTSGGVTVLAPNVNSPPHGYLDEADCSSVRGWTVDPDTQASIQVHIYRDGPAGGGGTIVDSTAANVFRPDLGRNAGYAWPIPESLKDGTAHSYYVYGIDSAGGTNPLLVGSPKSVTCAPPNHVPTGALDSASCNEVRGWTVDPDTTSPIAVHFYVDGPAPTVPGAGQTVANVFRPDLGKNAGFVWSVPEVFRDGRSHSVYAYGIDSAGGTNPLLPGSPKSFACILAPPDAGQPPPPVDPLPEAIDLTLAEGFASDTVHVEDPEPRPLGAAAGPGPSAAVPPPTSTLGDGEVEAVAGCGCGAPGRSREGPLTLAATWLLLLARVVRRRPVD